MLGAEGAERYTIRLALDIDSGDPKAFSTECVSCGRSSGNFVCDFRVAPADQPFRKIVVTPTDLRGNQGDPGRPRPVNRIVPTHSGAH